MCDCGTIKLKLRRSSSSDCRVKTFSLKKSSSTIFDYGPFEMNLKKNEPLRIELEICRPKPPPEIKTYICLRKPKPPVFCDPIYCFSPDQILRSSRPRSNRAVPKMPLGLPPKPVPPAIPSVPLIPGTPLNPGTPLLAGTPINPGTPLLAGTPINPGSTIPPGTPLAGTPVPPTFSKQLPSEAQISLLREQLASTTPTLSQQAALAQQQAALARQQALSQQLKRSSSRTSSRTSLSQK